MNDEQGCLPHRLIYCTECRKAGELLRWRNRAEKAEAALAAQAPPAAEPVGLVDQRNGTTVAWTGGRTASELPHGTGLYLAPQAPAQPLTETERVELLDLLDDLERYCQDAEDSMHGTIAIDFVRRFVNDIRAALAPQAPAAQPAPRNQFQNLQAFAKAIMGDWPDVGGLDGFELQMLGIEHGLLQEDIRHEPCGEVCRCAEYLTSDEWQVGVSCYSKTELLTGIAPPAQGEQTGEQAP